MKDDELLLRDVQKEAILLDRKRLQAEVLPLTRINTPLAVGLLVMQWVIIAAVAGGAIWSGHWLAYVIAVPIIASRQNALSVLVHDAIHYRFLNNRILNDLIGDLALAMPIGFSVRLLRAHHLMHHRHNGTELDPDLICSPRVAEAAVCREKALPTLSSQLGYFFGRIYHVLKITPWYVLLGLNRDIKVTFRWWERAILLSYTALGLTVVTLTNMWIPFLVLWVLPVTLGMAILLRIRGVAEHTDAEYDNELNSARYVEASWLECFFIAPINENYHLQHHLFPSVPHYNLDKLHEVLMRDPVYRDNALISHGYLHWMKGALRRSKPSPVETTQELAAPR